MSVRIVDGEATTAQVAEFERDRRELIRRGLAFGGTVVAASSIPLLLRVRTAFAQSDADGDILRSAIGLEQVAVLAYETAAAGGALRGSVLKTAKLFGDHEREHVEALTRALQDAGGSAPAPPESVADAEEVKPGLAQARTQREIVEFAIELEIAAIAAYYDAHRKLRDAALLQTGASIMANEGQHLVVLRQVLGREPVPDAFATGE